VTPSAPQRIQLSPRCLVNGEPRTEIDLFDRGLAYGDGLFETIAVRQGRPCRWLDHLDRLAVGALRLRLPLPSPGLLKAECNRLVADVEFGTLKLILTRGPSPRGYRPPPQPRPTRIWSLQQPASNVEQGAMIGKAERGLCVRLCATRLGINPQLAGLKHLNRLEQVLARGEWDDPGIDEGLMCDAEGYLVCGTMSNLFLVTEAGLVTPPIDRCGVAGTARGLVLRAAAEAGLAVREQRLRVDDLLSAEGVFLTNAVIGVWPIRRFEDRDFDLSRLPGSWIEQLREQLWQPEPLW
jgi:4-amino-4-deoxychorismate lyase